MPCSSQKKFSECCQPILEGIPAETAEQLMRARYTAYSQLNLEFIEKTHDPKTLKKTDMAANKEWAENTTWLGLEILSTERGQAVDQSGRVEFRAKYQSEKYENFHHEISEFNRRNGTWYFTSGKTPWRLSNSQHRSKSGQK